jgi:hypothetical protein
MSEQSHYEILSDNGRSWNVEAIVPSNSEATERAHDVKRLQGSKAVKVVHVSFNNDAGEFREHEVLFLGNRRSSVRKYGDGLDAGSPCHSLEHLFSLQSRQAIRRVMRQWLDAHRITPVELLHHPEYINRFEGSGSMLQSAVQRAAMAQAGAYNQDVKMRQRELYDLVDKVSAKAKILWRAEKCPIIHNDDLDELVATLADEKDKDYLFCAALTNWLRRFQSGQEKFIALLEMATRSKKPATTAHLDGYLTDFFEDANTVAKLIGNQHTLGGAVLRLADLVNPNLALKFTQEPSEPPQAFVADVNSPSGEKEKVKDEIYSDADDDDEDEPEHPAIEKFREVLRRGRFPKCRQTLIRRIDQTLTGPRSLSNGGVLQDAQLLAQLHERLCDEDGKFVMGSDMEEAFTQRSQRYVSGDAVGRMLEGVSDPVRRVSILLDAVQGIFGKASRQRIGDYIVAVLKEPKNQESLRNPEKPPAVHMRNLGTIQRRILDSGLSEKQLDIASEILDDVSLELLERAQILSKIAARSSNSIDECISILKLCAAGTFTEGRTMEQARARAAVVLRSPGFAEAFLRRGQDKKQMQEMLVELEDLMTKAGISDLPLMGAMVAAQA